MNYCLEKSERATQLDEDRSAKMIDQLSRDAGVPSASNPSESRDGSALPFTPRRKLVDYTLNRNPKYTCRSFEKLEGGFSTLQMSRRSGDFECFRSPTLGKATKTHMPTCRSIETGSFIFEERLHLPEERIEFMFKIQPKRSSKSDREGLLATLQQSASSPRIRGRRSQLFSSFTKTNMVSVPKRNHSAPSQM
jgi:hypothetical protein